MPCMAGWQVHVCMGRTLRTRRLEEAYTRERQVGIGLYVRSRSSSSSDGQARSKGNMDMVIYQNQKRYYPLGSCLFFTTGAAI